MMGWRHVDGDLAYWALFIVGQGLFLLKRASMAMASPLNKLTSRWTFFKLNWPTILIRTAFEFAAVLWPYRHQDTMANWLNEWKLGLPFTVPESPIIAFVGGYFSDSILDWIVNRKTIFGLSVPGWLREQIPSLPNTAMIFESQEKVDK